MDLQAMIQSIKSRPDFGKVGMILCHNGVVRQASRDGKPVTGLRVRVDHGKLNEIISRQKTKPGILEVLVDIKENTDLKVGDDVMFIVVAGDIRETVIETLTETLNRVKSEATSKEQFFR
ncbi:MAG: molybdenum cofactor biosynthesis protein MoaE [Pseudomonadota bacterium]